MIMEYLAQIAAFLVAVVAIMGDTWDRKRAGVLKFTFTGWIVSVSAIAVLCISLVIVHRSNVEERVAEEQRNAVEAIARMEVCLAALRLKFVLDVLVSKATNQTTEYGSDIGFPFDVLTKKEILANLKDLNILREGHARPLVGDHRTLEQFISEETRSFVDLTNLALSKYSPFLGKELILDATRLSSDNLVRRFLVTGEQAEQVRNRGDNEYPGLWPHETENYFTVVDLLQELLKKTGARRDVMACAPPPFFGNV